MSWRPKSCPFLWYLLECAFSIHFEYVCYFSYVLNLKFFLVQIGVDFWTSAVLAWQSCSHHTYIIHCSVIQTFSVIIVLPMYKFLFSFQLSIRILCMCVCVHVKYLYMYEYTHRYICTCFDTLPGVGIPLFWGNI